MKNLITFFVTMFTCLAAVAESKVVDESHTSLFVRQEYRCLSKATIYVIETGRGGPNTDYNQVTIGSRYLASFGLPNVNVITDGKNKFSFFNNSDLISIRVDGKNSTLTINEKTKPLTCFNSGTEDESEIEE